MTPTVQNTAFGMLRRLVLPDLSTPLDRPRHYVSKGRSLCRKGAKSTGFDCLAQSTDRGSNGAVCGW